MSGTAEHTTSRGDSLTRARDKKKKMMDEEEENDDYGGDVNDVSERGQRTK